MASIERTAYPRFKRVITAKELHACFTPTSEEIQFAHACARGPISVLSFLVLLKSVQYLHYFPSPKDVPSAVVEHVRSCLNLPSDAEPSFLTKSLYRHQKAIREHLNVSPYSKHAVQIGIRAVYEAAQVMDNPADLVNVALETWTNHRYEFPAFSTVDRLARRIRTLVNRRIFETIQNRLALADLLRLEAMLERDQQNTRTAYDRLKMLPKSSSRSHLQELIDHITWLMTLGETESILFGISAAKIHHFAAEAKALDAREMKDVSPPKQTALMVCLLHQTRVQTRDNLVEMFLKYHRRVKIDPESPK